MGGLVEGFSVSSSHKAQCLRAAYLITAPVFISPQPGQAVSLLFLNNPSTVDI